jgi:CBS domain-containing protein
MQAHEVMTARVVSVTTSTPIEVAIDLLVTRQFALLPVVDDVKRLVGVLTATELVRGVASENDQQKPTDAGRVPVAEVMCTPTATVSPQTDTLELVALMFSQRVPSIPVVENDRLVGIVTRGDVVRGHQRNDGALRAAVERELKEYPVLKGWRVHASGGVVTISGRFHQTEGELMTMLAAGVTGVEEVRLGPAIDQATTKLTVDR